MIKSVNKNIPHPSVMPIDREKWAYELNISNFINSYYQCLDLKLCNSPNKILIVGPGQGLDTEVLKWLSYEVTTFDIDDTFKPDLIGSVHDLSIFNDCSFDVVIASHVLEHLAEPYLDICLSELARVGRYSLIYLPVAGRHFQFQLKMDIKGLNFSWIFDIFNWFIKPDGITPRYCGGQHFWEIGMKGFRVADIMRRFGKTFEIVKHYRNKDWNPSYNFVLKSRQHL